MHIAIVCRYLTAGRGGHERYLKRLIFALLERGCRMTVFSGDFDSDLACDEALKCVRVPYARFPQWLRYLSFNRNARRAVKGCNGSFDLVFSTEYVTFGDLYRAGAGLERAEIEKSGTAFSRLSIKSMVKTRLQERLLKSAGLNRIIVNSESMRTQIVRFYGIPKDRIALIYNGIDTDRFSPRLRAASRSRMRADLGLCDDDFVCLTVGTNWRRKGIDRVIKMPGLVPAAGLRLLVVGEKPGGRKLSSLPAGEDRVAFCGSTSLIEDYYAASDLCIVASRYDPAPNVVLEALACGLPVALSSECGLTELFKDGKCGRVFCDVKSLAGVVEHFMQIRDSESYRMMQENAALKGKNFSMPKHVDKVMEILQTTRAEIAEKDKCGVE